MIGNVFRRVALAQGLLPYPPLPMHAESPPPASSAAEPVCLPDKPAMADCDNQKA